MLHEADPKAAVAAIFAGVKAEGSPERRALLAYFQAELRRLSGAPLTDDARERQAFRAAWKKMAEAFGIPSIYWIPSA